MEKEKLQKNIKRFRENAHVEFIPVYVCVWFLSTFHALCILDSLHPINNLDIHSVYPLNR